MIAGQVRPHTEGVQRSQLQKHHKRVAVLEGMLPHYDVFVEASTPHGEPIQLMYCKALELDDAGAVSIIEMLQKYYSKQVTS